MKDFVAYAAQGFKSIKINTSLTIIFKMRFIGVVIILTSIILFISGCVKSPIKEEDIYKCVADSDCIPKPDCHPRECINQNFKNLYKSPDLCTAIFDCNAAYKQKDCICSNNKCVNKNLGNKGCPEIPNRNSVD